MSKPTDDLEAVRVLVEALEPFESKDRERIIRWAREKLGMTSEVSAVATHTPVEQPSHPLPMILSPAQTSSATDIRTFIERKSPRNDRHLAAVVAYYHHFEAPSDQRKDSISAEDIIGACLKADRARPKTPSQTLINTYHDGFFDRTGEPGRYRLNSVGENLVAMVLPETESPGSSKEASRRRTTPQNAKKKTVRGKKSSGQQASTKKPARKRQP